MVSLARFIPRLVSASLTDWGRSLPLFVVFRVPHTGSVHGPQPFTFHTYFMHRHPSILKLASVGFFATSIWCHCLGAEEAPKALTLREVIAQAMADNPELKVFESEVAAARGERRAAGQWKNPEITAEYGEKRVSDREGNLTSKGNAQAYSINQTFEFPGKASLRKAIKDHDIHLAEISLAQLRLEVSARAHALAVEWLVSDREATAAREVADRSETLVHMLSKRAPAGAQLLLDQRIIEASMVGILTGAREAQERREMVRIGLNVLRGTPAESKLNIQASLEPPVFQKDWNALKGQAETASLLLKARVIELERADKSLSGARLGSAPDITIGPFFSQENAADRERVLGLGVTLPLPLWDSNRGQVDVAKAGISAAQARQAQALRDTEREMAQEYAAYQLSLKQLDKTPVSLLVRLREAAELADRQYRLGAVSVQTYLDMQSGYLEATKGILGAIQETHERLLRIQVITNDPALQVKDAKEEAQ